MKKANKIAIGTAQFGLEYGISNKMGQTNILEVKEILNMAIENSILKLDTASAYGNSELILGSLNIDKFDVISKFMPTKTHGEIRNQLNKTLSNLKLNRIYGYISHRPESVFSTSKEWEDLIKAKKDGLVYKIGFSVNTIEEVEKILKHKFNPDILQAPFNILDRRFEKYLKTLHEKGCEIYTRSTFLQGLLLMKLEELPSHFDDIKEIIRELQFKSTSLTSDLLNFVTQQEFVDFVIVGVEGVSQLRENILTPSNNNLHIKNNKQISDNILSPSNWPKFN